jgi:hypothetical protein
MLDSFDVMLYAIVLASLHRGSDPASLDGRGGVLGSITLLSAAPAASPSA